MKKKPKSRKRSPARKPAPQARANPNVGRIGWIDLTVKDAPRVRDFYAAVVGWEVAPLDCGGYEDYCLNVPADGSTIAGLCHAVGANAALPPQWLVYVNVACVAESVATAVALGGALLDGPRKLGGRDFACIQDPAGACVALIEADPE